MSESAKLKQRQLFETEPPMRTEAERRSLWQLYRIYSCNVGEKPTIPWLPPPDWIPPPWRDDDDE